MSDNSNDDSDQYLNPRFAYKKHTFIPRNIKTKKVFPQIGHKQVKAFHTGIKTDDFKNFVVAKSSAFHDTIEKNSPKKSTRCPPIMAILLIFSVVLFFFQKFLDIIHPKSSGIHGIKSIQQDVDEKFLDFDFILSSADPYPLIPQAVFKLESIIGDQALIPYVKESVQKYHVQEKIWRFLKIFRIKCMDGVTPKILSLVLSLLHDLGLSGIPIVIPKNTFKDFLFQCGNQEELLTALSLVHMSAFNSTEGLASLQGTISDQFVNQFISLEYGPWLSNPIRFLTLWSIYKPKNDQTSNFAPTSNELNNMCKIVDFLTDNQGKWNKNTNAAICLLSNVLTQCQAFNKIDTVQLSKRDECSRILQQTQSEL